jgi:UDP-N-acetylmuramate dehydrogenase
MKIQENISLKPLNTFGIEVFARHFAAFSDLEMLKELVEQVTITRMPSQKTTVLGFGPIFILGGGSNILFTSDLDGLVLKNEIKGIQLIKEDEHHLYVRVGAGEDWQDFVSYCIQRNWAGVENLSLIPGKVGAAPMQNIGAYGVELKEVFEELDAFHLEEKKVYSISINDCQFGYRDSVFKNKYRNQFVILNVTFRLSKIPRFHIGYGAIGEELERMRVKDLTIADVSKAVIHIRSSKLPDPAKIGNAGSFFKNPVIPKNIFQQLKKDFPGIVGNEMAEGKVKLAAAWMIEDCGWKGFRKGDAGCHQQQALVLVNFGHATGMQILDLSEEIMLSVKQKFGVLLEREVNII